MPGALSGNDPAPLLLIAGEASGDQHGADLVDALRQHFPRLSTYGVGGAAMRAVGVETVFDVQTLNVVGGLEVLGKIPAAWRMARCLLTMARQRGTRVVVLIDAPGFNLTFARWAKQAGLRVVYYVSPQIWAWRQGRVKKVARRVDKMLTLFPFEVPFYTAAGVDAEYTGHPLLDRVQHLPSQEQAARTLGIDPTRPLVALLPGSRRHEVQRLLPLMLESLHLIRQRLPQTQAVFPVATTLSCATLQAMVADAGCAVTVLQGQSHMALRAAHFAMVASGTATLEAGLIGTPMVVVYKMHPVTTFLAKRFIRVPYISLVNIIAERCLVPELIQQQVRPRTMAAYALQCLEHPATAAALRQELATLRDLLGTGGGAQRAAACVAQFLHLAAVTVP